MRLERALGNFFLAIGLILFFVPPVLLFVPLRLLGALGVLIFFMPWSFWAGLFFILAGAWLRRL